MITIISSVVRTTDIKKALSVGALGLTVLLVGVPFWAFASDRGPTDSTDWMRNEKHSWYLRHSDGPSMMVKADQNRKVEKGPGFLLNSEKHIWYLYRPKKSESVEKARGKAITGPSLLTNEKHSWYMKQAEKP